MCTEFLDDQLGNVLDRQTKSCDFKTIKVVVKYLNLVICSISKLFGVLILSKMIEVLLRRGTKTKICKEFPYCYYLNVRVIGK